MSAQEGTSKGYCKDYQQQYNNTTTTKQQQARNNNRSSYWQQQQQLLTKKPKTLFVVLYFWGIPPKLGIFDGLVPSIWPISMNRQDEKMLHFNSLPDRHTVYQTGIQSTRQAYSLPDRHTVRLLGSSPSCASTRPDSVLVGQEVCHFPDQTVCQCVTPPSVTGPRHAVNLKTNHQRTISDKVNNECVRRLCSEILILQKYCCDC